MAISTRLIRRRIRSVQNTKKITKAMEMVSGAKMRRAVQRVSASRTYAQLAWETVQRLKDAADPRLHRLLNVREIKKVGVVIVSSNRGLCGGFNTRLLTEALRLRSDYKDKELVFITLGKKVRDGLRRRSSLIEADFEKADITTSVLELSGLSRLVIDGFVGGTYDEVVVVYTNFKSAMSQVVHVKQLLPIEHFENGATSDFGDIIFEPSPAYVLNTMLPRLIEMQIYQAVLESEASEHSARMLSMRTATDAAGDMIDELTLIYNRARQAAITREISEIVGGKAALE